MARREGNRDDAPVGVAEKLDALQAQVLAQALEVGDVVLDHVGAGIGRLGRAARPARVEQDELELVAQTGQVAEVQRREAGASTVADQDGPLACAPVGQTPPVACL